MPKSSRDHVPLSPRPDLPFAERIASLEASFSGRIGFHAVRLEDGEEVGLRADERFPTASVIKVGLCCAALELVAQGEADLAETLTLPPPGERVAGGGILKQLEVETISLRDAIELTITLSDNVATNALVERCGPDRVNSYLAGLGLVETRILGPVDFARTTHDLNGGIGVSTPREQTTLLTSPGRRLDSRAGPLRVPARRARAPALPGSDPALARLEPVRAVSRPGSGLDGRQQDR